MEALERYLAKQFLKVDLSVMFGKEIEQPELAKIVRPKLDPALNKTDDLE